MTHLVRVAVLAITVGVQVPAADAVDFHPALAHLDEVPMAVVPAAKVSKAMQAVKPAPKSQPLRFAVSVALPLSLADGRWEELPEGVASWRLRIFSAGAESLNLEFARFRVPDGGALWLYDPDGRIVQGPYTHASENPDGKLWTALVPGEEVVLELRVPAAQRDRVQLSIAKVNHGFRSIQGTSPKSLGASGACEIDVACPQGDAWRNEIRAVALITINGTAQCSGQLVNNVRQNDAPLFLTADHCGIGSDSDDIGPAESVVFFWNFQNSMCAGVPDAAMTESQSGSTLLADDRGSDFTLVQLLQAPPSVFNVFLAGWDAGSDTPQSGAVIHHPQGDAKKIALFDVPAVRQEADIAESGQPSRIVQAWRVTYSEGTTEKGSSGAALFNQNHEAVGVLSGGNADCSSINPSINNGEPDFYGRLEVAWIASSDSAHQLKAWLDPDNTGAKTLCGKSQGAAPCSAAPPPSGGRSGGGGAMPLALSIGLLALGLMRTGKLIE